MKSKEILKWTKWFYRALILLIVIFMNVDGWYYFNGGEVIGGFPGVVGYWTKYKSLHFASYICIGVILIGLALIVLSFKKSKKFFTVTLTINAIVMMAFVGASILLPVLAEYEMTKMWWVATASSVILLVASIIGMVCEQSLAKEEVVETKNAVIGIVTASIYGIIILTLIIIGVVVKVDKGWRLDGDTLYIEREMGISHISADPLWGKDSFRKLKVEEGVKAIYNIGLKHNADLEEVELPRSLEIIGSGAFWECDNLERVIIPENVIEIESFAFSYDIVLIVYKDSYAEKWAIEYGYEYEIR